MGRGRAINRHHRDRIKDRRRDHFGGAYSTPERIGKLVKTKTFCQTCCSQKFDREVMNNVAPRYQRADLSAQEQIDEAA